MKSWKRKLRKSFTPPPREEGDEFFPNGIFEFNVTKILRFIGDNAERFPVKVVSLDTLPFTTTEHLDEKAIRKANVSNPIVLAEIAPGRFNVIDGNHRVERARRDQLETIPAYRVFAEDHVAFLTSQKSYEAYVRYWNEKVSELR